MSTLALDTAVEADAVARLTDMYRGQPVILAITKVLSRRWAAYEAVLVELYSEQWIDTADGDLLDALGEIVGEPRLGRADELYRRWIRARVLINRAQGRVSDTVKILKLILESDVDFEYVPEYPAAYSVKLTNFDGDEDEVFRILDTVRPAGVGFHLEYVDDVESTFTLDADDSPETLDTDLGLADDGQTTGGILAGDI